MDSAYSKISKIQIVFFFACSFLQNWCTIWIVAPSKVWLDTDDVVKLDFHFYHHSIWIPALLPRKLGCLLQIYYTTQATSWCMLTILWEIRKFYASYATGLTLFDSTWHKRVALVFFCQNDKISWKIWSWLKPSKSYWYDERIHQQILRMTVCLNRPRKMRCRSALSKRLIMLETWHWRTFISNYGLFFLQTNKTPKRQLLSAFFLYFCNRTSAQ